MKVKLTLVFLLMSTMAAFAQQYTIEGKFTGIPDKNVYLIEYHEGNQQIVDTAKTDQQGAFSFTLSNAKPGMYVVYVSPQNMLELVFNNENISFETTGSTTQDDIHFLTSKENKIYYDYIYVKINNQNKLNLLRPTIRNYPKEDPFYSVMVKQYDSLVNQIANTVKVATINDSDKLATRFIRSDWPVIPPAGLSM